MSPDERRPLAHNTDRSGPDNSVPVIIEDDTDYPFGYGERDADWHEASDVEYAAYVAYWNAQYDGEGS